MNGHIIFCLKEQQDDAKLQTSLPGSISPTGVGGEASRGASLSRLGHSMKYVHAIDLGNPHPCWNLRVSGGRLQTPNFIARIDSGIAETHRHIGNISLEELRTVGPQGNVVTPRTGHVLMKAAMLRNHVSHLDGYGQEVLVSPETRNELLRLADQELEFERVRRVAGGNLVSRISCLWLAERNEQGILRCTVNSGHSFIKRPEAACRIVEQRQQGIDTPGGSGAAAGYRKSRYIPECWP